MHKFTVGQIVEFKPDERTAAPADLTKSPNRLPHNGHEYEYRIKSGEEKHGTHRKGKSAEHASGGRNNVEATTRVLTPGCAPSAPPPVDGAGSHLPAAGAAATPAAAPCD